MSAAIHQYCRAAKREHDRALRVLAWHGRLRLDYVYRARLREARKRWAHLPPIARAAILEPKGE